MNPTNIAGSRRQRITTRSGVELERQYIFMTPETWDALQRLCISQHRSGSQVVASLINIAAQVGHPLKEKQNEQPSPRIN